MTQSSEVHLTSRPQGNPVATDFQIVEVNIEDPAEGQVLVKNIYMSVDPLYAWSNALCKTE